jgi:hypothetical protein
MTIAFGFAMITYYAQPIPGFGVSFHSLITNEGFTLANQLNNGEVTDIFSTLDNIYFSLEVPVIAFDIIAILHFILIVAMIIVLEAAVFFVIAFGYIAAAVAVLLGPVFIPFFIVPKMEWLFWGWFKAFLQYSFYPVVANAYLYVFGSMLVHLVDSHPPPYDGAAIALLFTPLLFLMIAFTYGVVKIPSRQVPLSTRTPRRRSTMANYHRKVARAAGDELLSEVQRAAPPSRGSWRGT